MRTGTSRFGVGRRALRGVCYRVLIAMVVCAAADALAADRPQRTWQSEDGTLRLRIDLGVSNPKRAVPCRATLFREPQPGQIERRWDRALVNDRAPQHVLIEPSGNFVVTLDEFGMGGVRHALVVYGAGGELLHRFRLLDLLTPADWESVSTPGDDASAALIWQNSEQARIVNSARGPVLALQLVSGRSMRIHLGSQVVIDEAGSRPRDVPSAWRDALFIGQLPPEGARRPTAQRDAAADRDIATNDAASKDGAAGVEGDVASAARAEVTERPAVTESRDTPRVPAMSAPPLPSVAEPVDYAAWLAAQSTAAEREAGRAVMTQLGDLPEFDGDGQIIRGAYRGLPSALADADLNAWLKEIQPDLDRLLERLREADAAVPYERAPSPAGEGLHAELLQPRLDGLGMQRRGVRVASIAIRRAGAQGDPEATADAVELGLRLSRMTSRGLMLIDQLTATAMQQAAYGAALQAVQNASNGPELAQAIVTRLERFEDELLPLRDVARGEQAFVFASFQETEMVVDDAGIPLLPVPAELQALITPQRRTLGATAREASALYDTLASMMDLPPKTSAELYTQLQTTLAEENAHPLLKELPDGLRRAQEMRYQADVRRSGARLALELIASGNRETGLPTRLSDAQSAAYRDPFSGRPLIYRRVGDGFVLYSVGPDVEDNGGPNAGRGDLVIWPPSR